LAYCEISEFILQDVWPAT